jgi:hypothetical protein
MTDLRDLKAIERRKQIRKYIRRGLKQVEMAEKLKVDITTISHDVDIIQQENMRSLVANKRMLSQDNEALLKALSVLDQLDQELWDIYYGKSSSPFNKVLEGLTGSSSTPTTPETKISALDKIRQNNKERSSLLKLLNPTQITTYNITYVEKMIPILIQKYTSVVLGYVPKEKQIELLEKLKTINLEDELNG